MKTYALKKNVIKEIPIEKIFKRNNLINYTTSILNHIIYSNQTRLTFAITQKKLKSFN